MKLLLFIFFSISSMGQQISKEDNDFLKFLDSIKFDRITPNTNSCTYEPLISKNFNILNTIDSGELLLLNNTSCSDLFSEIPPVDLQNDYYKSKDKIWFPICSTRDKYRYTGSKNIYSETVEWSKFLDTCAENEKASRYSSKYVPSTQNEKKLKVMSHEEEVLYKNEISKIKSSVSDTCCEGNDECKKAVDNINIEYCKQDENPNKPDPCTDNGAFYTNNASEKFIEQLLLAKKHKNFHEKLPSLISGSLTLSIFKNEGNFPNNGLRTIAHELSHGCSFIKSQIEAKNGSRWSLDFLIDNTTDDETKSEKEKCEIDNETAAIYIKKLAHLGYSDETIECALKEGKNAINKRFVPGKCKGGCPKAYIEEFFANASAFKTLENSFAPIAWNDMCDTYRDQEHYLGRDYVRCILKTEKFKDLFIEQVKCQK